MRLSDKLATAQPREDIETPSAVDRLNRRRSPRDERPGQASWEASKRKVRELVLADMAPKMGHLSGEGLAREVIRLVQDARKADGLDVSDRITLRWAAADPELAAALTEHGQLIAGEVLATEFGRAGAETAAAPDSGTEHRATDLGLTFWIRRS